MTGCRGAFPRFGPRRLDGLGSLGRLPLAPPSPRGGGQASSLRDSARSSALRFAARYGSSDSLGKASPAPIAPTQGTFVGASHSGIAVRHGRFERGLCPRKPGGGIGRGA